MSTVRAMAPSPPNISHTPPGGPDQFDELENELINLVGSKEQNQDALNLTLDITSSGTAICVSWKGEAATIGCVYYLLGSRSSTQLGIEELVQLAKYATVVRCVPDVTPITHANGFQEMELEGFNGFFPGLTVVIFMSGTFDEQKVWTYKEVTMPYDEKVFGKPTNVTTTRMSGDKFALNWEPPASADRPITGYCVSLKNLSVGGSVTENRFLGPDVFQFSFTALEIGSAYNLSICAWDGVNVGPREHFGVTPANDLDNIDPIPEGLKYNCWWCEHEATNSAQLDQHYRKMHAKSAGPIFCEQEECQKKIKFVTLDNLIAHMGYVHGKCKNEEEKDAFKNSAHGLLMETKCRKDKKTSNLNKSTKGHAMKKIHLCKICNKPFSHPCYLKRHLISHSGEKPFECKTCHKTFTNSTGVRLHEKLHSGVKSFECQVCQRAFSQRGSLDSHMKRHTGEKPYKCKVCAKTFAHRSSCLDHEKLHSGLKPFQCQHCQKNFSLSVYLIKHMRGHTGERPYKCTICFKTFSTASSCSTHKKTHSGIKPFKCKTCNETFQRRCNLDRHVRVHTREKPYICDKCPAAFERMDTLQLHEINTHSGFTPHRCKFCNKGFLSTNLLHSHTLAHLNEKPHFCKKCDTCFALKGNLIKHMRSRHKE